MEVDHSSFKNELMARASDFERLKAHQIFDNFNRDLDYIHTKVQEANVKFSGELTLSNLEKFKEQKDYLNTCNKNVVNIELKVDSLQQD